jgi:hypothetical protein
MLCRLECWELAVVNTGGQDGLAGTSAFPSLVPDIWYRARRSAGAPLGAGKIGQAPELTVTVPEPRSGVVSAGRAGVL